MRCQVEPAAIQNAVVREQQVSLRPEQHADRTQPRYVTWEPSGRQDEPECRQGADDGHKEPDPAGREFPEPHQELGSVRVVHRPRAEEKNLTGAERCGKQHGAQAAPTLVRPEAHHPAIDGSRYERRKAGCPDQQDEDGKLHRGDAQPVAQRARILWE